MVKPPLITKFHIAPCGMNCHLCMAFLRMQGKIVNRQNIPCPGCRGDDTNKARSCLSCRIKTCEKRNENRSEYCFQCDTFPCTRLKQLDKRYRTKYEMSMIKNLEYIRDHGVRKFVKHEQKRWVKDDKVYCVHHHKYY